MKKLLYSGIFLSLFACNSGVKDDISIRADLVNDEVKIPKPEKGYLAYETDKTWIMYPKEWSLDTASTDGLEFFIYSPLASADDKFQENINLTAEKLPNNSITTEYYIERALETIKSSFGDVNVIENKERNGNFGTYRTIIYTSIMSGIKLKWKQSVYIKNSTAYIVSYTEMDNTYDNFKEISDKVMNSFIVK